MTDPRPRTRIQEKNRATILEAALDMFSQHGFRGATLDQIAKAAGLSKPNVLYYFPSKEAIHGELLAGMMELWLAPLRALDEAGDPVEEILAYVDLKLDMARDMPRESRLFAGEVLREAPWLKIFVAGSLKGVVDEKAAVLRRWAEAGQIADVDPYHLFFSIWATTQHYADFDIQVRALLAPKGDAHFDEARAHLRRMYAGLLTPGGSPPAEGG